MDPFADLDTAAGIDTSDSRSTIVKSGPVTGQRSWPGTATADWVSRARHRWPRWPKVGLPRDKAWIIGVGGAALLLVTLLLIILFFGGGKQPETIITDRRRPYGS